MHEGPNIAAVAALIGDPGRANMLTALMDGRALTVSELAEVANITIQTASGHLAKLAHANLLVGAKQGRHRYYRLADADVAEILEALMGLAQRAGAMRVRPGPKDEALRTARICYDHLAGRLGVGLLDSAVTRGLVGGVELPFLTDSGKSFFSQFGIDVMSLEKRRRPVCRNCLDWSERRNHLGGGLGAAVLNAIIDRKWASRSNGRLISFTRSGESAFSDHFKIHI